MLTYEDCIFVSYFALSPTPPTNYSVTQLSPDIYLAVQAQTQQHEEEESGPQLGGGHGGEDVWVHHKHQART